ncbi:Chloroperoxidase [Infundibulicybe gibba]|nr:Chloroperoxidase [Infundibulicybe gibba]
MSFVKSLLIHSSSNMKPVDHSYIPADEQAHRAPCPALNMLANHGYINRTGHDISIWELFRALRDVFNLSFPLAILLSLGALFVCRNGLRVDLQSLAEHNAIEHNYSLVHRDASPGSHDAPIAPSKAMLSKLIKYARPGHGLSLGDFARARYEREHPPHSKAAAVLDSLHSHIATGESALTWGIMRDSNGEVPINRMREFYGDERIPEVIPPLRNQ